MSNKLPLEIRRNYSIKDKGTEWHLTCDACSKAWSLQKPKKGEKVHGGNILHLLEHAERHRQEETKEEEPAVNPAPPPPVVVAAPAPAPVVAVPAPEDDSQPDVIVELAEPPSSQINISKPKKHSYPCERTPNAYMVEVNGRTSKVSNFRDPSFTSYLQVQKIGDRHRVMLYAANAKHALLVGERIIETYINNKQE